MVLAMACGGAFAQSSGEACSQSLSLLPEGEFFYRAKFVDPCAPYQRVEVAFGGLNFVEETSIDGTLELVLPRWAGVDSLSLSLPEGSFAVSVPDLESQPIKAVGVVWNDGVVQGRLGSAAADAVKQDLGFWPADGTAYAQTVAQAVPGLVWLDLPVTDANCGATARASVARPEGDAVSLSVEIPGCDAVGQTLRIPLVE